MNIVKQIEQEEINKIKEQKIAQQIEPIPDFAVGDTIKVSVRVTEGAKQRIQVFEGVCIARASAGINKRFTVRKISFGEGVERIFPLYSPSVGKIEVVKRGKVRRAKLYYLRNLRGKAARIAEKRSGYLDKKKKSE